MEEHRTIVVIIDLYDKFQRAIRKRLWTRKWRGFSVSHVIETSDLMRICISLPLPVGVLFAVIELNVVPVHKRGFFCKDPAISYAFTGDTVTMTTLLLVTIPIPVLLVSN